MSDRTFTGSAKRPLELEDYTLKVDQAYSVIDVYVIIDMEDEQNETLAQGMGLADICLMDCSGAMQSLAVAVTALVAISAF